jgi:dihydrodipicolinate synthase/N-acetylneuraminate lyase
MNQNQSLHTPRTSGSTAVEDLPAPSGFPEQLTEIYPVPPLARRSDAKRSLDFDANMKIFRHLVDNGVTRIVYGGNAFLYQITMAEYAELTDWLGGLKNQATIIPAVGSSYGRAMDQAPLIRRYGFPSVLVLPTGDPRDAIGMERGMHEIANACGVPLMLYVKHELDYGADIDAGIEAIGRLVDSKVCAGIKYAIVRKDPAEDAYLARLVQHVDPLKIISGIGERPAVTHLRKFKLSGFTTGSGVVAPKLCRAVLDACRSEDYAKAGSLREEFIPLEDLRDAWGPSKVLHAAVALAGIADTGSIPPWVSEVTADQAERIRPVAQALFKRNAAE